MNIIDGFQKEHIKMIERFITGIGWILMLSYIIQIILSLLIWAFNLSNFYRKLIIMGSIHNTIHVFAITIIIALAVFFTMYTWGRYNFKKYAHLRRRKFPCRIVEKEIMVYFNLPAEIVEMMQNEKIIVLEKTIV